MKIIYAGTPEFAVPALDILYDAGYKVDLVVTQEDRRRGRGKKLQPTAVKAKAIELEIPVFQPENINSKESIDRLKSLEPDLIIVTAYGQVFSREVLDIPKYGCINLHASILPKYRGAAPLNWVLINGETETGVSLMEMEEGLDTGDVLAVAKMEIKDEYNCEDIHDRLAVLGPELLVENIEDIVSGNIDRMIQDDSKSSYAPMIYRDTGHIDWNKSGREINNLIRGVYPWPGAYSYYNDEMVKIHKISIIDKEKEGKAGEIVDVSNDGIIVNTLDDAILIEELQFPNRRRMKVQDYIAGNDIEIGTILK